MSEDPEKRRALPDPSSPDYAFQMVEYVQRESAGLARSGRAMRPRDAATIVILRRGRQETEVLMGRRHSAHKFLPDVFVFPGGGVDIGDARVFPRLTLAPETAARLVGPKGIMRARAIGLAGIRETFEETGIVIGHPLTSGSPPVSKTPAWKAFAKTGHLPALETLEVIARAITPPVQVRRYDTWFFGVDIEKVPVAATPIGSGSGELEELQWVPLADTFALKTVPITQRVLFALKARIDAGGAAFTVPFLHFRNGRYISDEI